MKLKNKSQILLSLKDIEVVNTNFFGKISIIKDISFHINKNEILTIVGENGSGKSTILNVIANSIKFKGEALKYEDLKLSYMPQKIFLKSMIPMNVLDFFNLFKCNIDLKLLNRYSISKDFLNKKINNLSGGKQQVVLFLSTLMQDDSNLILLDEPESGVDKKTRELMYEDLYLAKFKKSIVIVSHDDGVVSGFSDRVICIKEGKVHCFGGKKDLSAYEDMISFYNHTDF